MASNKWLRDFESGVSRKQNRRRQPTNFVVNETLKEQKQQKQNSNKILIWGEYFEPVEKNYTMSIEAISGHRPRCKRQIANKRVFCDTEKKEENEAIKTKTSSLIERKESVTQDSREPMNPRDYMFSTGSVGRVRSGSYLVKSLGSPFQEKQNNITTVMPVRSEAGRLLTFNLRNDAPTSPMEQPKPRPRTVGFKTAVNIVRAAAVFEKSKLQKEYADQLSQPRVVNDKVFTDGRDKTMWEEIELKSSRLPGPAHYDSEASLKRKEATSGGKFNMSRPKSDIEWNIKRSSELPDPGSYNLSPPKVSGGKFNMSEPLSDIDLRILQSKNTPGPHDYASVPSNTQGGGRFNESQSKSDIEWKIHRAKEIPGPGEYVVKTPENKGGRFNESRPMSDVDVMISRAASLPGPGEYASSPQKMSGGKFNMSNPKSDIDVLIYEAAQSPGPSDYIVKDDIVRQSSHTGKFPFVYRPENAKLKKFARAVNTIRTMNRFKEMGALQKLMEVSNMDEKGAKLKKAETEASLSLIVDNTPPISPTPCPVKGEGKEDTMEVKENAEEKEA